jgi:hypothetical protein
LASGEQGSYNDSASPKYAEPALTPRKSVVGSSKDKLKPFSKHDISIGDLYLAYRKAKVEAYYESTHFQALAFTEYEQNLHENLTKLRRTLLDSKSTWSSTVSFIGTYSYVPKSISTSRWDDSNDGHFCALHPLEDWARRFKRARKRAEASLRLVIRPTVDFQVVSALWIMKVGYLFDGALDSAHCFANRLRRRRRSSSIKRRDASEINLSATGLFEPYFTAYREWREQGLSAMDHALVKGKNILAITMDIEKFYHRVSPKFLLRKRFLKALKIELSGSELFFTRALLKAIDTWYRSTPDYRIRPEGAIPVGLSASKIIANVLLADFDGAVTNQIHPIYYGRYVDDIFLIFENTDELAGAKNVTAWLSRKLSPLLGVKRNDHGAPSLAVKLAYAFDSDLIFTGAKQKIFSLSSMHGLDLIQHIREQIRIQSSEYRLLPVVPGNGAEMASRALLATPDAKIQVDALRKADVVSVRRLGLSLLLRDLEVYSADLRPRSWGKIRDEFYGLVQRHILTPNGIFEFANHIPRIFGLMLSCRDLERAEQFLTEFTVVAELLRETTTLGQAKQTGKFATCLEHFAGALKQTALQAATERMDELDERFLNVLRGLDKLDPHIILPSSVARLRATVRQVLLADWGRRPYKAHWYLSQTNDEPGPPVPKELEIRRLLRLGGIRKFRKLSSRLKLPHWPALAFSTRPLSVDEISLVAPAVLLDPDLYRKMIMILRGARVTSLSRIGFDSPPPDKGLVTFVVPGSTRPTISIAVTSYKTTEQQWLAAARNRQDRSLTRYAGLNALVNRILQETTRPDYIIFPELSVPLKWALRLARKLAKNSVSFLAGVEYYRENGSGLLRNDVLTSLVTRWPGYASHVVRLQPKFEPAHSEKSLLRQQRRSLYHPTGMLAKPTLYVHKGFCFCTLICSDLTNISHRNDLRGQIDALFVLEWNPDVKTFSSLVEATASDLHAFVAQVNNREYGDSRVRAPAKIEHARDVVQVKGGETDFYVLGKIDYLALRKEQRRRVSKPVFKPTPIGFKPSNLRKNGKP